MEWVRGQRIGHGSFCNVNLAIPRNQKLQNLPLMAVKSCSVSHSASLVNEKLILDELKDCPQIIQCYGDCFTSEKGENLYNLFLEYVSGGDLAGRIKNSGDGKLSEFEVQRLTKSILKGLHSIHYNGYAHCDIKPQNILLCSSKFGETDSVKIADFGLAKKIGKINHSGCELRGTLLYMSPEMVADGEQETAADIWALGCLVAEMVSGAPAWRCGKDNVFETLLMRIGVGEEVPEIPGDLCDEGKDFLGKCFVKNPRKRWTAEMLLNHPFVVTIFDEDLDSVTVKDTIAVSNYSPRSAFDFPDCEPCEFTTLPLPEYQCLISPAERLGQLMTDDRRPEWSFLESWVTVR